MTMFGWFRRKRQQASIEALGEFLKAEREREIDLRSKGWTHFLDRGKWPSGLIDIIGPDDIVATMYPHEMNPMMNCANLYWRPSIFEARGKDLILKAEYQAPTVLH